MKNHTKIFRFTKPLCFIFDKVNGFIRDYDGTKYLVLFGFQKFMVIYLTIYDRIRYLIGLKAAYVFL